MTLLDKTFIAKEWTAVKALVNADGTVTIEGWVSTNHSDMEKDVAEPEAFEGGTFSQYFYRGAPLSSEHNTTNYPIGYLQKGSLVRDGTVIQEAFHPVNPAQVYRDFSPSPTDSGWYGIGLIDDPIAAQAVAKGKMRSFSWIGSLKSYEPIAGGGRRFIKVDPLIEATVTAYPMNPNAVMRIAKAYMGVPYEPHKLLFTVQGVENILSRYADKSEAIRRKLNNG